MKTLKVLAAAAVACALFAGCGEKGTNPPTPATHTLTTNANPAIGGKVSVNGGTASTGTTTTYNAGTQVTATATPNAGYTFTGWSGASASKNASVSVAVNSDLTLTANFQLEGTTQPPGGLGPFTLTINPSPAGGGTVTINPDKASYDVHEIVYISAFPAEGYTFGGWMNGTTVYLTQPITAIAMTENLTLTASFQLDGTTQPPGGGGPYSLTITPSPAGGGTVTRNPDKASYTAGDVVVISATPAEGYTFRSWTGGTVASSSSATTTVTMSANMTLTANFKAPTYYLSTSVNPSNGGAVLRNPDATSYEAGTQVTVTAMSAQGYEFVGWAGASSSTSPSITVTMDGSLSLTAGFRIPVPVEMRGTLTVGGQTYNTVKIGTQLWMAENLNVATDSSWCYNNSPDSCAKSGRLYAWNAAKKACSGIGGGWHLPDTAEWRVLENYVGGSDVAGKKLKSVTGWSSNSGTDDYGFSALPSGERNSVGNFYSADWDGYWWSATGSGSAYYQQISGSSDGVSKKMSSALKQTGYAVRCVRDN